MERKTIVVMFEVPEDEAEELARKTAQGFGQGAEVHVLSRSDAEYVHRMIEVAAPRSA